MNPGSALVLPIRGGALPSSSRNRAAQPGNPQKCPVLYTYTGVTRRWRSEMVGVGSRT